MLHELNGSRMAPLRSIGFVDPGWEHGIAQDERKKKVKCNYCGKVVSGGIYRLKQHLARISGEVTYCKKAPDEVYVKMKENLEGYRSSRRQRQSEDEEFSLDLQSDDDGVVDEVPLGFKRKGKQITDDQSLIVSMAPLRSSGFVDPGWEHGVAQDEKKKKVKCNYCEKIVSGGINRFKQHLARIPGEVAYCKMAPKDVYLNMKDNMKWHRIGRRQRPEAKELAAFYMHSDNNEEEELPNGRKKAKHSTIDKDVSYDKDVKRRLRGRSPIGGTSSTEVQLKQINVDSILSKTKNSFTPPSQKQSKLKTGNDKKSRKEVLSAICRFFCYAAIPFSAVNSPYFQKMLDLVGQYGQGLKSPSCRLLSGQFLQDEVVAVKEHLGEIKASWAATGCTILAESWKDVQGRMLINFLVSCPRGVYFVSSVDALDVVEDVVKLFNLLDKVVEEVGEDNVVQVITQNTPCYKAAGKMLEEKRRRLFWTPCAASYIDQMLEDFTKIKWVGECIEKGQKITRFIYNRAWLLDLMKKEFTAGRELLKQSVTRFSTSFGSLETLLEHRIALRRMFQSIQWTSSQSARTDGGKEVEKIVLNSTFWKKMQCVRKSVDPILQLLKRVDSDKGLYMPSIYNDMCRAKIAIKGNHGDNERKYGPLWSLIDHHWDFLFHHPLYVAAYFLNPSYRYHPDFIELPEVIRGLNECITRLEPDNARRVSAAGQISDFVFAKADFGTELALSTRTELDPATWWQQHGINCLELRRIAVRILSQTCSSFGCDHHWSAFDHMYSIRHNHLAQKRLYDRTYVHYNLRLRERQLKRTADDSISLDSALQESLFENWIVETETSMQHEDEEILYNEAEQAETCEDEHEDLIACSSKGHTDPASSKGHTDPAVLSEIAVPIVVHPAISGAATDEDDADLDFLDDDLSD